KTYAPTVTRRKDIGQTEFDQCLSCGAFSSCCSHWSRRLTLQSTKSLYSVKYYISISALY
ncbi:MAG: hypothetical protein ABS938_20310, partial [Psychrobacillus psychrodurans]